MGDKMRGQKDGDEPWYEGYGGSIPGTHGYGGETETSERWEAGDNVEQEKNVYTEGFSVVAKPGVLSKMFGWCKAAKSEVSGMFLVRREGGAFTIYDAFILKQKCTSASTEIEDGEINRLMEMLAKKKIPLADLKGWWHTHYNFGCFWSGTDIATCERLCGNSKDWSMAIVLNQSSQYICRLDVYNPLRMGIDRITIAQGTSISESEMARYKKDIADNVSENGWEYGGYSDKPLGVRTLAYGSTYGNGGWTSEQWKKWWQEKDTPEDSTKPMWKPNGATAVYHQGKLWEYDPVLDDWVAAEDGVKDSRDDDGPPEFKPQCKMTIYQRGVEWEYDPATKSWAREGGTPAHSNAHVKKLEENGFVKSCGKWIYRGKKSRWFRKRR